MVAGEHASVGSLVEALRPATAAPLVVLASPPGQGVVELVSAGVDAVIDPQAGPDEVFARVMALLRRLDQIWEPGVRYLVSQDLQVDLWSQQCESAGRPLHLSPTEYALLTFLMTRPNQALPAQTIVRKVWGWPPTDGRNALRIFVNRLRRKLGDDPHLPRFIESVRGTGYRFVGNVTELGDTPQRPTQVNDAGGALPFLESLEDLALGLAGCQSTEEAVGHFLNCLERTGYADAVAVFRLDDQIMRMVDQRRCPAWWVDRVKLGVPLQHSFASAHSVITGETVCFADVMAAGERFSSTAKHFVPADFHAAIFIPILRQGRVWGNVGLGRRSRQPFDSAGAIFLRSAVAILTLVLDRFGSREPAADLAALASSSAEDLEAP
ncbi:MAG: winged helix-turn-helix domain-containing protein [Acidobacteriota bacterium]|nr:winged helix-turn-helix domain-containing protein [Acidobacteriota bacterium]